MSDVDPFERRMTAMLAGVSPAARAMLARRAQSEISPPSPAADFGHGPHLVSDTPRHIPQAPDSAFPSLPSSAEPDDLSGRLRNAFFAPISLFIVRERLPSRETGRIAWADCERLWAWLGTDLVRAEIEAAMTNHGHGNDPVSELRSVALGRATDLAASNASSTVGRRRLASQIGGDDGFATLSSILAAFGHAEWAADAVRGLPAHLTQDQIDRRPGIIAPVAAAAEQRGADTAWLYSALLSRLESPATLARIAVLLANTDREEELSHTRHAAAIDILLSEIEVGVERLRALRGTRAAVDAINKTVARYRHLVRQLTIEVDLKPASRWTRRLATAKMNASAQLEHEVTSADGLTRQVLRTRLVSGATPTLDADLLDDAERSLRVLNIVTESAEVFTLNAAIASARRDVGRAFEALVDPLINALRTAEGEERGELLKRCDGAIRLAGIHYGPEFGAILQRSRNVAISGRIRAPAAARI